MTPSGVQRTIAAPATLSGRGLFSGRLVNVSFRPADENTGIVFRRTDLPGAPTVRLGVDTLASQQRCSAIRLAEAKVTVIEHLLAALAGLFIDNLLVEADGEELPCLDGSAAGFAHALRQAGIVDQEAAVSTVQLGRQIAVRYQDGFITASPNREGLDVSCTLDYGDRYIGRQTYRTKLDEESFLLELAPARTYVLRSEIETFLRRGLGKGATPDNTIVVEEDGTTPTSLRFPDECVRHKVLDLIGDLRALGARLSARVRGYKSGHLLNRELVRRIHAHTAGPRRAAPP